MDTKLNIRFHNPNGAKETADFIIRILMEANKTKMDQMIRDTAKEEGREVTNTSNDRVAKGKPH